MDITGIYNKLYKQPDDDDDNDDDDDDDDDDVSHSVCLP